MTQVPVARHPGRAQALRCVGPWSTVLDDEAWLRLQHQGALQEWQVVHLRDLLDRFDAGRAVPHLTRQKQALVVDEEGARRDLALETLLRLLPWESVVYGKKERLPPSFVHAGLGSGVASGRVQEIQLQGLTWNDVFYKYLHNYVRGPRGNLDQDGRRLRRILSRATRGRVRLRIDEEMQVFRERRGVIRYCELLTCYLPDLPPGLTKPDVSARAPEGGDTSPREVAP